MKVFDNLDVLNNEIQNAVVQNLSAAPASPLKGSMYFDTTDNTFKVYNGTAWETLKHEHVKTQEVVNLNAALSRVAAEPNYIQAEFDISEEDCNDGAAVLNLYLNGELINNANRPVVTPNDKILAKIKDNGLYDIATIAISGDFILYKNVE